MSENDNDLEGDLLDVTDLSLRDLDAIGESRLARALRQVLDGEDITPVAGFSAQI
jgi:FXSXX-COOH protein